MKLIKKTAKALFSNDPSVSSKRVFGGLGIISVIVLFYIIKFTEDFHVDINDVSVIRMMLIVFGVLVAGGSLESVFKNRKNGTS